MSIFQKTSVGIDMGTTKVITVVPNKGISSEEPSVVAISDEDNEVIAIGREAGEIVGREPSGVSIYHPIKGGVIVDHKHAEIMLRYFLRKSLGRASFIRPNVMVSVPSAVSSTERRIIIDILKKVGASKVYLEKEPVLAALGSDISILKAKGNLILDIGGGTSDSAVISLGGIVASKSIRCAGSDIDRAIVNYIAHRYKLIVSERVAEEIKMKGASAVKSPDNLGFIIKGKDMVDNLPRVQKVYVNELVPVIQKELDNMLSVVKDVFHEIPPELVSDIIEQGIVLTGGTSKLNGLPEFIQSRLGIHALLQSVPEQAVIRGLATLIKQIGVYNKVLLTKK